MARKHFSLLEVIVAISIIVVVVVVAAQCMPAIENYRFKKNQKRLHQALCFCYGMAKYNHCDVLAMISNENQGLSISITNDQDGDLFSKGNKKEIKLKNFWLQETEKNFLIRFSSTGWIFPLKTIH